MPASDPIATLIARAMLDGGLLQLRTRVQAKIDELEASVGYAVGEPTPETAGQEQAKSLTAKHRNAISKGQKSRWKKPRQPQSPMPPLPAQPEESIALSTLAPPVAASSK
jgi:hypothetical protein